MRNASLVRILGPLLIGLALSDVGSAAPAGGCAPPGLSAPGLSLHGSQGGTGGLRLRVQGEALGRGWLLAAPFPLPAGPAPRPAGAGCLSTVRGSILVGFSLDSAGAFELPLAPEVLALRPRVTAVVVAPGMSLSSAGVSNAVRLGAAGERAPLLDAGTPQVLITEFQKDPTSVSDSLGEWIEVQNVGSTDVDLEGWVLADLGSDSTVLAAGGQGMPLAPGSSLVLGRSTDTAQNGGVAVDHTYSGMTLSNGADEILLLLPDGTLVDGIAYDDGAAWPDEAGKAIQLAPAFSDAQSNDDGAAWCSSPVEIVPGGNDTGTPGVANVACG